MINQQNFSGVPPNHSVKKDKVHVHILSIVFLLLAEPPWPRCYDLLISIQLYS